MNEWPIVKLGDHVDLLTGFPFKSKEFTDDDEDIPLIRGYNIMQGWLRWENLERWSKDDSENYSQYFLQEDDVVLAMDRPWVSAGLKYSWISKRDLPCLLVQRVARLRGTSSMLTRYLRYVISSDDFAGYLRAIVTGVNVPHISAAQIRDYAFLLPPLEIQRKIAAVLSAYDDLIENNTRRIQILEEMAQAIYRQWFVEFKFPGYEGVPLLDSGTQLGEIPEGWEIKTLGDFGKVVTGKTPSKKVDEYWNSCDVQFIRTPDMHDQFYCIETTDHLSLKGADSQSNKYLSPNSLCVSCIGTVGIVTITAVRAQTNQQINSIVLHDLSDLEFLYFSLLNLEETIKLYGSTGATMANLSRGKFMALRVITPSKELRAKYHEIDSPMFEQIKNLQQKNANLRATRDLLLPRLVSGKVDISELEIQ
jgi:type I restriction enzyme S subunit